MAAFRILVVCAGNICRSPLGEAVLRETLYKAGLAGRFDVDSAGTGGWHDGDLPDPRSIQVAAARGIDITGQRARKIRTEDFDHFDLILAMDRANLRDLARMAPADSRADMHLYMEFANGSPVPVPDPYYDDIPAFEAVYTMLLDGSAAIVERLAGDRSLKGNTSSVK